MVCVKKLITEAVRLEPYSALYNKKKKQQCEICCILQINDNNTKLCLSSLESEMTLENLVIMPFQLHFL